MLAISIESQKKASPQQCIGSAELIMGGGVKKGTVQTSFLIGRSQLTEKMEAAASIAAAEKDREDSIFFRQIDRVGGTFADLSYPETGTKNRVRMFGSNSYLGLSTHPLVVEAACAAARRYGVGMGGSSFLNGYSTLQRELEEMTAELKGTEDCIVFASGYCTNTSWTSALVRPPDQVVCDAEAHMSFREGIRSTGATIRKFKHNSIAGLEAELQGDCQGDKFVFVEGVYSMRGDVADVGAIYERTARRGALLLVDDAHGTGTQGPTGRGTTEELPHGNDLVIVGTYSKAIGCNGGFICGSKDIINVLRLLAPSYMFSTALSPPSMAGALQALRIIASEPERIKQLQAVSRRANRMLRAYGCVSDERSPIQFVGSQGRFDATQAAKQLQRAGCFVSVVRFPAVSRRGEGIRISFSSEHTDEDLDYLEHCLATLLPAAAS